LAARLQPVVVQGRFAEFFGGFFGAWLGTGHRAVACCRGPDSSRSGYRARQRPGAPCITRGYARPAQFQWPSPAAAVKMDNRRPQHGRGRRPTVGTARSSMSLSRHPARLTGFAIALMATQLLAACSGTRPEAADETVDVLIV